MMNQILLLEDDQALGSGIALALQRDDLQLTVCKTLAEARKTLAQTAFDLLILDVNLPDGSGLELLKEVRAKSQVPIIFLTANDMEMDVVTGLELGADDYITKPFSLAILRARVHTQLRRSGEMQRNTVEIGPYSFDFSNLRFCVDGVPVELSKTEQKLLRLLVENRGQVMERSTLVDRIWTDGADFVDENALSVTVKRLRDKLDAQAYIKTIYGVGYSWVNEHE